MYENQPMSKAMQDEWKSFVSHRIYQRSDHTERRGKLSSYFTGRVERAIVSSTWGMANETLKAVLLDMARLKSTLLDGQHNLGEYTDILIDSCLNRFLSLLDKSIYLAGGAKDVGMMQIAECEGDELQRVFVQQPITTSPTISLSASFNSNLKFITMRPPKVIAKSSTNNTFLVFYDSCSFPLIYNVSKNIYLFLEGDYDSRRGYYSRKILSVGFSENNQFIALLCLIQWDQCDWFYGLWVWSAKSGKELAYMKIDSKHQILNYLGNDTLLSITHISNDVIYLRAAGQGNRIIKVSVRDWPACANLSFLISPPHISYPHSGPVTPAYSNHEKL